MSKQLGRSKRRRSLARSVVLAALLGVAFSVNATAGAEQAASPSQSGAVQTQGSEQTPSSRARLDVTVVLSMAISVLASLIATFIFVRIERRDRRRSERDAAEAAAWQEFGVPIVDASDQFIGRIWDIVAGARAVNFYDLPRASPDPWSPSFELTTVFRLARILAAGTHFQRNLALAASFPRLAHLRYYLFDKARWAMKGGAFTNAAGVPTEGQQWIGGKLLSATGSATPAGMDFYAFITALKNDGDVYGAMSQCSRFLTFAVDTEGLPVQFRVVCVYTIYLIDAVHDLLFPGKWEELRLFLVEVLREYNRRGGAGIRLYRHGDLVADDYLRTLNPQSAVVMQAFPVTARRRVSGADREVQSDGIRRRYKDREMHLVYGSGPAELLRQLRELFG